MKRRECNIAYYNFKLNRHNLKTNAPDYLIKVANRKKLQKDISKNQIKYLAYIQHGFYYEKPLNSCSINERSLISTHLLLPVSEYIDPEDLNIVIETVKDNLIQ